MSATAPTVARPRARLARLGTARLAVSLPKAMMALAFLVGVSLALRTHAIHARFWIDEGLSVGVSSHSLTDIPGVLRLDGRCRRAGDRPRRTRATGTGCRGGPRTAA